MTPQEAITSNLRKHRADWLDAVLREDRAAEADALRKIDAQLDLLLNLDTNAASPNARRRYEPRRA